MQGVVANMSNGMQVDQATLASAFKLNADPSQLAAIAASMLEATPATYSQIFLRWDMRTLISYVNQHLSKDFASKDC